VIIGSATAVKCGYYARFARFLFRHGFDVLTFDYRGIGLSRPLSLKGFNASWLDWGELDYEAIFDYAQRSFPNQPIDLVAHSIGGFIFGLAESSRKLRRVLTVGSQYAYAPDYAPDRRLRMILKWHVIMPLLTWTVGYFPGKWTGWLEDTPEGIVSDWVFSGKRFENRRRCRRRPTPLEKAKIVARFASLGIPVLAIGVSDDEFGTVQAIERGLSYLSNAGRTPLRISPASIGKEAIGHFGFFHGKFEKDLWEVALYWLRNGALPANCPGEIIARGAATHDGALAHCADKA
jgi:predicted alpha/beta hydrolase